MTQAIQQLLQSFSDVLFPAGTGERLVAIDSIGYDGETPMHAVAWRNDLAGLKLLIAGGADVNAQGEMNETPLHIAVTHRNMAMIQVLLKAGARDDIRCEFGDTPRERAASYGKDFEHRFQTAQGV